MAEKKTSELSFEESMKKLDEISAKLESGNCSLDESLKLFEESTKLINFCSKTLKNAEQKITKITALDTKNGDQENIDISAGKDN